MAIGYVVFGGLLGFAYWRALDKSPRAIWLSIAVGFGWPLMLLWGLLVLIYAFFLGLGRVE